MKLRIIVVFLALGLHFAAYGQRKKKQYFIEIAPTTTFGFVGNSLHYNHTGARFRSGYSAGLGFTREMQNHPNWHWVLTGMLNKRQFELNRTQPYSNDPVSSVLQVRNAYGAEALLGIMRKIPYGPSSVILLTGGITQNAVGKQFQTTIFASGPPRESETFGFGSVTLRNRVFLRAGAEFKVAYRWTLAIEGSASSEIRAPFVQTIDKVNPLTFGLHARLVRLR